MIQALPIGLPNRNARIGIGRSNIPAANRPTVTRKTAMHCPDHPRSSVFICG
jgi:hypothetical protein